MANDISFPFFVALWNRMQGMGTPEVHFKIAAWLEDRYLNGAADLLLTAFRGCGKSTLVGLFVAWVLSRDANLRVLVVGPEGSLAAAMVRNTRRVMERHPLTQHLRPHDAEQWGSARFTVVRPRELRDASMTGRGLSANLTGGRAELIICDDVEVPNTADSASKRAALRTRLQELSYLRAAGGRMLYVGTPHAFDTIYTTEMRGDIAGHVPFLGGCEVLRVPVVDATGVYAWPEKFSPEVLSAVKHRTGNAAFRSQMLLQPVNLHAARLNHELVQVYDEMVIYNREVQELFIGAQKMVSACAWWDPSLGKEKSDGSVLAIVYTDARGHAWVQRVLYLQDYLRGDMSAQAQCESVAKILKEYHVPAVGLETNGIGGFLPKMLREEIVRARCGCSMRAIHSTEKKSARILRAFDVMMAARMLHVHAEVMRTRFATEMRDWRPDARGDHDDGLDAVAGALSMEPMRLPPMEMPNVAARPGWQRSAKVNRVRKQ